jgi:diguanylate cyclase
VALRHQNEDQASLLARADKAMYQAKQSGKNRVVVAD